MSWHLVVMIALIVITLTGSIRTVKIIYLKKLIMPLLCISFILCLIAFSKTAVASAYKGIRLWIEIVFPSLFPFFVASELLSKTGFVKAVGALLEPVMRPLFNVPGCGSFALAMGFTSGYPVGAKITAEMRKEKLLTKAEAERLLTFTNNSGPLFIIGAVSVGIFKMPQIGLFMLACHILAGLTVGIIFRFYGRKRDSSMHVHERNVFKKFRHELTSSRTYSNLGQVLGDSVKNSVNLLMAIGGFIIFFSVIINLLLEIGFIDGLTKILSYFLSPLGMSKGVIASIISGLFEITTGTSMAGSATDAQLIHRLTSASIIIGWAGLSVHSQVFSIIGSTDISIKPSLLGKFMQGIFAGIYTYGFITVAGPKFSQAHPAFVPVQQAATDQFQGIILDSFKYLVITIALIALPALISAVKASTKKTHIRTRG